MSEPQVQQTAQPSGKASLKDGKEKCPLQGQATVVLKPKDGAAVEAPINIRLKSQKGSYMATTYQGTATFPEVVPDTYTIKVELAEDGLYIAAGPAKTVKVEKQKMATMEQPIRKKPWIGWKLVNLDDGNKDITTAKFKVAVPPAADGDPPQVIEVRPTGDQNVAKVEKLRGETVELQEVETDVVMIVDSVESA